MAEIEMHEACCDEQSPSEALARADNDAAHAEHDARRNEYLLDEEKSA
jgi:hypothetical protein